MTSEPVARLRRDVLYAFVAAGILFGVLFFLNEPTIMLDNISVLNSTTTTALGILFTVLAIIYTFESQFEDNRAVKILKEQGEYHNISEIFVLSVGIIGIIWIFTFSLSITQIHKLFGVYVSQFLAYLVIVAFFLLILRLYRCFRIFVLLNRAVKAQE